MEILKKEGVNPLPKINFRYGNPQPQIGVRVDRFFISRCIGILISIAACQKVNGGVF
jgi:predicted molibdopterin-dependent oxidoreductase YjgC